MKDDFDRHVLSFYSSDNGICPFNCSDDTIIAAISFVETACLNSETFAANSMYRKTVRAVLEAVGYREQEK